MWSRIWNIDLYWNGQQYLLSCLKNIVNDKFDGQRYFKFQNISHRFINSISAIKGALITTCNSIISWAKKFQKLLPRIPFRLISRNRFKVLGTNGLYSNIWIVNPLNVVPGMMCSRWLVCLRWFCSPVDLNVSYGLSEPWHLEVYRNILRILGRNGLRIHLLHVQ